MSIQVTSIDKTFKNKITPSSFNMQANQRIKITKYLKFIEKHMKTHKKCCKTVKHIHKLFLITIRYDSILYYLLLQ